MENKEILDGIKSVSDKMDEHKKSTSTEMEQKLAGLQKQLEESQKKNDDARQAEIKQVSDDMAKQGKTLGEIAEAQDKINTKFGKIGSMSSDVKDADSIIKQTMTDHWAELKALKKGVDMELEIKAGYITISSVSSSGSAVNNPMQYLPGVITRPSRRINIRDLVPVVNVETGSIIYYRQTPGAVGTGSFGFQAGQTNVKAQLDYTLQQRTVTLDYLAGFVRVAKQMMDDMPGFQDFLSGQLQEDYRRSESAAFVPSLLSQSTAFTPAATVTAERIVQAIADLLGTDWQPNGIVTDATTWAKIMNTKPNDYSLPGGGSAIQIATDGTIYFLGMPIVVQNNIGAGNIIVGDFSKANIFQKSGMQLGFFEQDVDNVQRNVITARLEARVAFEVLRTDAFDRFTAGTT